jgi:hypothetical protein
MAQAMPPPGWGVEPLTLYSEPSSSTVTRVRLSRTDCVPTARNAAGRYEPLSAAAFWSGFFSFFSSFLAAAPPSPSAASRLREPRP